MGVIRDDFDVEHASPAEMLDYIYDLEFALREYEPVDSEDRLVRLRAVFNVAPAPLKILLFLADSKMRTKASLYAAFYAHRAGEGADEKIIDVYLSKLRAALKGAPFRIETIWGAGFRLVDPQGALKAFLEEGTPIPIDQNAEPQVFRHQHVAPEMLLLRVAQDYPLGIGKTGVWLRPRPTWKSKSGFAETADSAARNGWLIILVRGEGGKNSQWCLALTDAGIAHVEKLKRAGGGV